MSKFINKEESIAICRSLIQAHARRIKDLLGIPDKYVRVFVKSGEVEGELGRADVEGAFNVVTEELVIFGCKVYIFADEIFKAASKAASHDGKCCHDAFSAMVVQTIAHEFRHVWQYYSGWFQREVGFANFSMYESYEEYYNSKEECDAREFASAYLNAYFNS